MTFEDYPFESRWFAHATGLKQHYIDEGQGEPVLMVHGNPTWSFYYRRVISALRGRYRCIAPDHVGMGLSDKPADGEYSFALKQRVDDLDRLIDFLIEQKGAPRDGWTLVVHDWGGAIGAGWACRHPERIKRIVILNTATFPNPKQLKLPWLLKLGRDTALGAFLILKLNAFAGGAARLAVTKPMSRAARQGYLAPYDSPAHRLAVLRFVQDIPLRVADPSYGLVRQIGEQFTQYFSATPMLVCWGMRDFVFDRVFFDVYVRTFPQAQVHAFADAGHYVLEDAHAEILALLDSFMVGKKTV